MLLTRGLPAALILWAVCSCATDSPHGTPRRPQGGVVDGASGRVLYPDPEHRPDAVVVSRVLDSLFDPAAERLGERRDEPAEVWLDPGWPVHATTFERCIVFNPGEGRLKYADLILAHELVHWHVHDTALERNLPHTLVEGLCEWISAALVPELEADRRALFAGLLADARRRGALPQVVARLGIEKRAFTALPAETKHELYALGFTLVDRIGIEALREAAERGPLVPAEALELAGSDAAGGGL